ncbi:50S ribosomal protein L31, chloroplastic [Ricinus communis]|nr:50S ribosomal protein L31, chloroplastic [Ricinus communis]
MLEENASMRLQKAQQPQVTSSPITYVATVSITTPLPSQFTPSENMAHTLTNTFLQIKPLSPPLVPIKKVKASAVRNFNLQVTCRKKDIHPEFHEDAKVYCNGELVMTTGGTQKEYVVDVWSGNHPFYLGNRSAVLVDADQVEKFRKKFGELSQIMEIPVLKGEIILPSRKKSAKGKKK